MKITPRLQQYGPTLHGWLTVTIFVLFMFQNDFQKTGIDVYEVKGTIGQSDENR